ncbi:YraN family protein [Bacillus sp. FJAT-26390]|uniref:YraN family protein n=1 Tax=Bacillus sp. FJAT-26390 TaxID=1743142 RepID=UPI000807BA0F|nr:YraN family protein [Bacillus sp. FJAT-26390]OBZ16865.1 YraN family protein [Bacillus sp. FJAT-26390]
MVERKSLADDRDKRDNRKQTGMFGEAAACDYLLSKNYSVLERNWRCRSGEIDIIAEHEGRLVFIEVRARKQNGRFGTAAESVDRRKQQKVRETAQVYLRSAGRSNASVRFDVIAITINRTDETIVECKHYEGAF